MNVADGASSSTTPPKKYDVFISFRGEDTRNNFTSHLYAALCRKQIKAYIDENDLKRGDEISPALLRAIEESKLCLIILSKKYASSTWCLDELAHILQCKGKQRQEILPIFYKVDPSHVRKQQKSYATAFVEHEKRFKDKMDKVQAWRDALKEVGSLSGWASSHDK